MKNMKLFAGLCAAVMCLGTMTACSDKEEPSSKEATTTTTEATTTTTAVTTEAPDEVTTPDETVTSDETVTDEETTEAETTGSETEMKPPMWKVTNKDGNSMIMIGSMHALQESDYPLPDIIMDAYNDAEVVAFECDTAGEGALEAQSKILSEIRYEEGDDLSKHVSKEGYDALAKFLKECNIELDTVKTMKPWTFVSTIETLVSSDLPIGREYGIDYYLMAKTKEDGKELYEVETVLSQMEMLMGLSDEYYDLMFRSYGETSLDEQKDMMMDLYDAWKKGDLDTLYELTLGQEMEISEGDQKYIDEYNNAVLFDRNKVMAEAAEKLVDGDKKALFIVGAAHYIGDKGVVALLEKDGYTVERID